MVDLRRVRGPGGGVPRPGVVPATGGYVVPDGERRAQVGPHPGGGLLRLRIRQRVPDLPWRTGDQACLVRVVDGHTTTDPLPQQREVPLPGPTARVTVGAGAGRGPGTARRRPGGPHPARSVGAGVPVARSPAA